MVDENEVGRKSKTVTTVLWLFSLHRFYLGKPSSAFLYILTGGGVLVWAIMDLISILKGNMTDKNGNTLV